MLRIAWFGEKVDQKNFPKIPPPLLAFTPEGIVVGFYTNSQIYQGEKNSNKINKILNILDLFIIKNNHSIQ